MVGKWMTVGTVAWHSLDYRQTNENGKLDIEATLDVLKKVEFFRTNDQSDPKFSKFWNLKLKPVVYQNGGVYA